MKSQRKVPKHAGATACKQHHETIQLIQSHLIAKQKILSRKSIKHQTELGWLENLKLLKSHKNDQKWMFWDVLGVSWGIPVLENL